MLNIHNIWVSDPILCGIKIIVRKNEKKKKINLMFTRDCSYPKIEAWDRLGVQREVYKADSEFIIALNSWRGNYIYKKLVLKNKY